jgi:hypothetical protein
MGIMAALMGIMAAGALLVTLGIYVVEATGLPAS